MNRLDVVCIDFDAWSRRGADLVDGELWPMLDSREKAASSRMATDTLRQRYVIAHAATRIVLSEPLGVSPRLVELAQEACLHCGRPHGRPKVVNSPVEFSLAHCDDRALVAVTFGTCVGADIERVRPLDVLAVARQIATGDELDGLMQSANPEAAFFGLWVSKEAVVKATGEGIRAAQAYSFLHGDPPGWTIHRPDVGPAHVAAVATSSPGPLIRYPAIRWLPPPA